MYIKVETCAPVTMFLLSWMCVVMLHTYWSYNLWGCSNEYHLRLVMGGGVQAVTSVPVANEAHQPMNPLLQELWVAAGTIVLSQNL